MNFGTAGATRFAWPIEANSPAGLSASRCKNSTFAGAIGSEGVQWTVMTPYLRPAVCIGQAAIESGTR